MIGSGVSVKDVRKAVKKFQSRLKRALPKALNSGGEELKSIILNRTRQGKGLNGTFPKYSKGYKKTGTPNLKVSGDMLGAITVRKNGTNKVLVGFKTKKQALKAEGNSKKRPFMGFTNSEIPQIAKAISKQLDRDL